MHSQPFLYSSIAEWLKKREQLGREDHSIGFVPTMGALHEGHESLLERCRRENEISVLSIYVNPTQFNNQKDLQTYPSTLERDIKVAQKTGVDFIITPTYEQIYPDHYRYRVTETQFSDQLCGAHRPGHFDGVLTVVMKLFNLVRPNRAYFGEKDYQQLQLIKSMVEAFFLSTEIVACPTVRELDGLAMSSRNVNLPPDARAIAPRFYRALSDSQSSQEAKLTLKLDGFEVDYIEDIGSRRYAAAKIGGVRLIDNVER